MNGNFQKANRLTNEALHLLNRAIPKSSFDLIFGIFFQGLIIFYFDTFWILD